jgi:hypothetical protein
MWQLDQPPPDRSHIMTVTTKHEGITSISAGRRVKARGLGVAGAVLAAIAVWTASVPLLGVDLLVRPGGGATQHVGPGSVVFASLIVSLLGWGLLALLEHHNGHARAIWTALALVVMLLSLAAPLSAGVTTAAAVTLMSMHLAVAAVLVTVLPLGMTTR